MDDSAFVEQFTNYQVAEVVPPAPAAPAHTAPAPTKTAIATPAPPAPPAAAKPVVTSASTPAPAPAPATSSASNAHKATTPVSNLPESAFYSARIVTSNVASPLASRIKQNQQKYDLAFGRGLPTPAPSSKAAAQ